MEEHYRWRCDWGTRVESPDHLASRFCKTIDELAGIFPTHRHWIWADKPKMYETDGEAGYAPLASVRRDMPRAIERIAMINEGYEEPLPGDGFWLGAMTDPDDIAHSLNYFGQTGGTSVSPQFFMNNVRLTTNDSSLVSYAAFRAALLLLAETWQATIAINAPRDVPSGILFYPRCGWMTYASPRLARSIKVPAAVVVEHRDNGGLFMAATTDVFDVDNKDHMAAARRIERATSFLREKDFDQSIPYL